MSLDFPKRSDRKILERIIPPPSGGRDKLRIARLLRVSLKRKGQVKPVPSLKVLKVF